jgi:hypothetical protein
VLSFVALCVWLVPKLFRLAKRGFIALRDKLRGAKPGPSPSPGSTAQPT